ncbi:MAG: SpoIIE family protein phosphatase [Candidatus Cybelea sp.]
MKRLGELFPSIAALIVYFAVSVAVILTVEHSSDLQQRIRVAQVLSSKVIRLQLDEETSVRGYVVIGQRAFLDPYYKARSDFDKTVAQDRASLASIPAPVAIASLSNEERIHDQWVRVVAGPLIVHPTRADAVALQFKGKGLIDSFRSEADAIARDLNKHVSNAGDFERSFVNTLIGGGLVVGFALVGFLALGAARQRRVEVEANEQLELYERERNVGNQLQDALIMRDLPVVQGLTIHARYRPADVPERLGGDWYDVFALPNGRAFIVVGDVVGHGITATVRMSQLRNMIIAAALYASQPGEILTAANRQLLRTGLEEPAGTAVCAFIDPRTREIHFATAGHPPPLLFRSDRGPQWLMDGSLPLGIEDQEYATNTVQAAPGSLVVFYTDGLTELRRNVIEGEMLVADAARDAVARKAENPAFFIKRQVMRDARYVDDVAIVTVGFESAPSPLRRPIVETLDASRQISKGAT